MKKVIYSVVATGGILAASYGAWWYQNQPTKGPAEVAGGTGAGSGASGTAARAASGAGGGGGGGGGGSAQGRPPMVEAAAAQVVRISDDAQAVGSLRSRQSVVLRPEVSGRITQINFRDGERVRKGQLLVQLDDQLPQAQVKQAEAELSIARANHRRNEELAAQNFIARRAVEESAANLEVAEAKLALARATLQRLRVLAPFDGTAGIRSINIGDYLKDGADIVNIEDLEAVYVDFRLPERFQDKVRKGQTALVDFDAVPGRRFAAVIQAIDPAVDAGGRSVSVRGCIDNRAQHLRPGLFARITAVFGQRERAIVIPEEAIVPQGGRMSVFKLVDGTDKDTRVAQRVEVKVGVRQPGRVEIVQGLAAGDVVVTAGQQRIQRDGTVVRVVDVARAAGAAGGGGEAGSPGGGGPRAGASAASPAAAAPAGRRGGGAPASPPVQGENPCIITKG